MPRPVTTHHRASERDWDDCYPNDLLPDLQRTLAALADVELRSEAARERLEQEPPGIRQPFLIEIEARYRRERQPYIERLEHFQKRIRGWLTPGF
jgi:hypothetical protein